MATAQLQTVQHRAGGRSLWWRVHAWAGLKLSLLLSFILLTGTLATVAHEIDWLLRPAMRAADLTSPPAGWGTMFASAREELGEGEAVERILLPAEPWQNPRALVRGPGNALRFVYLERATGDVAGTGSWVTAQRVLRDLHRRLYIPTEWGIRIVAAFSLLLLTSLVTGLVTYRRFWRGFWKRPRIRAGAAPLHDRRFMGDLHRLLGLWSLPLLVVMIATGIWYLVEATGGQAPKPAAETEAEVVLAGRTDLAPVSPSALDAMVAEACARIPGLELREIRLPRKADEPVIVMGQAEAILVRDRANAVRFDPATGELLSVLRGEELNLHQRIAEAADLLHFGTFGGLATKLLYFVLGLALTALAGSGALVYSLRLAAAERQAPPRLGWNAWVGMGAWRYLSIAGLVVALILAPFWLSGRLW